MLSARLISTGEGYCGRESCNASFPAPPAPAKKASVAPVRRPSTSVPVIRCNEAEQVSTRPKREISETFDDRSLSADDEKEDRFSAVPNSEQIPPAPGQLGAGETKTGAMNLSRLLAVVPASVGALINIWCMPNPPGFYLESISDPRSRIYQEPDSWSRVIRRVGLILSSLYFRTALSHRNVALPRACAPLRKSRGKILKDLRRQQHWDVALSTSPETETNANTVGTDLLSHPASTLCLRLHHQAHVDMLPPPDTSTATSKCSSPIYSESLALSTPLELASETTSLHCLRPPPHEAAFLRHLHRPRPPSMFEGSLPHCSGIFRSSLTASFVTLTPFTCDSATPATFPLQKPSKRALSVLPYGLLTSASRERRTRDPLQQPPLAAPSTNNSTQMETNLEGVKCKQDVGNVNVLMEYAYNRSSKNTPTNHANANAIRCSSPLNIFFYQLSLPISLAGWSEGKVERGEIRTYQTRLFAPPVMGVPQKKGKSGFSANVTQNGSPLPTPINITVPTLTPIPPPSVPLPTSFPPTNALGQRICRPEGCGTVQLRGTAPFDPIGLSPGPYKILRSRVQRTLTSFSFVRGFQPKLGDEIWRRAALLTHFWGWTSVFDSETLFVL
ncbi:hypothetical protein M405DRAFT_845080 [Rhizopogon salebrosus TDB-379]|nr:hypothetical protein M405DRAFT_845080 [Rhizopogon salebrosus TDB-379]